LALLPYRLGRNAIVEAELEIKAYNETNTVDMELYERVRSSTDPLHELLASLRTQCLKQCALADKAATGEEKEEEAMVNGVALSPMVVIFVTTVLEHLAEYILTTIGVTAERQGSDYIRVKEVYWALLQDVQVGGLFKQTELRSKLEVRQRLWAGRLELNSILRNGSCRLTQCHITNIIHQNQNRQHLSKVNRPCLVIHSVRHRMAGIYRRKTDTYPFVGVDCL
jgi:hypothetical protein